MMKKLTAMGRNLLAMALVAGMLLSMIPAVNVEAASFSGPNGMKVEVVQGLTTLTLSNGSTVQLTPMRVAKDGGARIDANGTTYVIYRSGNIYFNNYSLQGNSAMYPLDDTDVIDFQMDGNGYATGYIKADGTVKSVLTLDQVKARLGVSNSGSTSGTTNGSTTNSGTTNNSTTNNGATNNSTINNGTTNGSTNNATTIGRAVLNNGVVTYLGANGRTYTLANDANISAVFTDTSTGTVYILYRNGALKIWNYNLQKDESTIRLTTISSKATGFGTNGGYYEVGNTTLIAFKTTEQITKLVTPASETTTTKKYVKFYSVATKKYLRYTSKILRDSNAKYMDNARLDRKTKKLNYHGRIFKKVKFFEFNKKGNLVYITTSGKLYVVKHTTLARTKKASGIIKFHFAKHGIARYAVRKNGTRFSITKY